MKINRFYPFLLLSIFCVTILVSCDSKEEGIPGPIVDYRDGYDGKANPRQVFENGMPTSINSMTIKTDKIGLVSQIVDGATSVKFEYLPMSDSSTYDVIMVIDKEDEEKSYGMSLDGKGFVNSASVNSDGSLVKWEFEYASGGYLTSVKKIVDGDLVKFYQLEWDKGNLVAMKTNYMTTNDTSDYNYSYVGHALPNKGAIMLWNSVYAIDIEELEYAYFAGILGKSTENLPIYSAGKNPMYSSAWILPRDIKWTLDKNGFPVEMRAKHLTEELDKVSIKW